MADITAPAAGQKRKRTGKQREEAKRAAMAKAEAEAAGVVAPPAEDEAAEAPEATETVVPTEEAEAPAEEAVAPTEEGDAPAEGSKKRKRTGKMRAEAKRLAIQARIDAGETIDEPAAKEEPKGVDFEQLAKRIPQGLKKLHPVFKEAKKAETMRLIKKIRFLKTKDEKSAEVAELETQLKLLSVVQLHTLATNHLGQKLKKHHTLKHETLPQSVSSLLPVAPSISASSSSATPEVISKVENRLCSAKQVADALKPTVAWVLSQPGATLNLRPPPKKAGAVMHPDRLRMAAEDSDSDSSHGDDEGDDEEDGDIPMGIVEGLDSDDEAVLEEKAADAAGWESGDDDEGAGWESGSVSGDDSGNEYNIAPPSDSDTSIAPAPKRAKADKKVDKPKAAPLPKLPKEKVPSKSETTSSTFLPSLAAGFAAGDSDSDPDMDYDPDGIIGTKKPERKNRRGQRARQAIWEKKYGKGAKHVVKAREEAEKSVRGPQGQKRDGGWGDKDKPRGGIAPDSAPVLAGRPSRFGPVGGPGAAGVAAAPVSAVAKLKPVPAMADGKELHPSWEAARLRKAKEMGGADAPKATKIVFD